MRERPILFKGPMVRALLDGTKTQTRRLVKWGSEEAPTLGCKIAQTGPEGIEEWTYEDDDASNAGVLDILCPYGVAGDRLWVRETFSLLNANYIPVEGRNPLFTHVSYRADHIDKDGDGPAHPMKWRPSIFMPRWASRIELEVTAIRAMRLQDISEEDAEAEGAMTWWNGLSQEEQFGMYDGGRGPIAAFRMLWDSINAKRGVGWDTNPWVWAVSFRRVKP